MLSQATDSDYVRLLYLREEVIKKLESDDEIPAIKWKAQSLKGIDNLARLAERNKLPGITKKERQAVLLSIIDTVAADLGNTRAVCKSSYIRPMFINDWESGLFEERWHKARLSKNIPGLNDDESTAFHYMRTHE